MSWERAIQFVLDHEGGELTDDPVDRGGQTKWGISRAAYPHEDIPNMTLERAAALIRRDYWERIDGDHWPWPMDLVMLDVAFNSGVSASVKTLQRTIGVNADGILGPVTKQAAREWISRVGPIELARLMSIQRRAAYFRYVARDPTQVRFLGGWMQRVIDWGFAAAEGRG